MAQQHHQRNGSEEHPTKKKNKKIIMKSDVASSELGKILGSKFDIRCGGNIQADIILPGPPISWAILLLDKLDETRMSLSTTRVDRMVNMFEHAIVVCIKPSKKGVTELQKYLQKSGKRHMMTKLLLFPDMVAASEFILKLCPLLCDATRRRNQSEFIEQLREDAVSESSLLQVVMNLIDSEKVMNQDLVMKDANLLLDRFRSLSSLYQYGESTQSFEELQQSCPIEAFTVNSLNNYFMSSDDFFPSTGMTEATLNLMQHRMEEDNENHEYLPHSGYSYDEQYPHQNQYQFDSYYQNEASGEENEGRFY